MPTGKTPPMPLVTTCWPDFKLALLERYVRSARELFNGPLALKIPVSWAVFCTSAETRQLGSPIKTTCEPRQANGGNPAHQAVGVKTGRLVVMPSWLPRSISMVRHQLAGSRVTTLASLNFHGCCRCQPYRSRKLVVFLRSGLRLDLLHFEAAGFRWRRGSISWSSSRRGRTLSARSAGQLLGGIGEAKKRQKQTAEGEFEAAGSAGGQA